MASIWIMAWATVFILGKCWSVALETEDRYKYIKLNHKLIHEEFMNRAESKIPRI